MTVLRPTAALLGTLALAISCSKKDEGGTLVSQRIGAEGGTVTTPGGEAELRIPARAVASPLEITIRRAEVPEGTRPVAGMAFDLGPDGTEFLAPVQLTLRVDRALATETLRIAKFVEPGWLALQAHVKTDLAAGTITAELLGFSSYILIEPRFVCPSAITPATLQPNAPEIHLGLNLDRTVTLDWSPAPGTFWPSVLIERAVVKDGPAACTANSRYCQCGLYGCELTCNPGDPNCVCDSPGPGVRPFCVPDGSQSPALGEWVRLPGESFAHPGVYSGSGSAIDAALADPQPHRQVYRISPWCDGLQGDHKATASTFFLYNPDALSDPNVSATALPCGGIRVLWNHVAGATSYLVRRRLDVAGSNEEFQYVRAFTVPAVPPDHFELVDASSGLTPGAPYRYRVQAYGPLDVSPGAKTSAAANSSSEVTVRPLSSKVSLFPGGSSSLTVSLDRYSSTTGDVDVQVANLPAGVHASVDGVAAQRTIEFRADAAAPIGEAQVAIEATRVASGSTCSLPFPVEVTPDFTLECDPPIVGGLSGASASVRCTLTSLTASGEPAQLACGSATTGIVCAVPGSSAVTGAGTSFDAVIGIGASAPFGRSSATVTATRAGVSRTFDVAVAVGGPALDVSCNPSSLRGAQRSTVSTTCTVRGVNGVDGDVQISCGGAPGIHCTPRTIHLSPADAARTLAVDIDIGWDSLPLLQHAFVSAASPGAAGASFPIDIDIDPGPDFRVTCTPTALSAAAGGGTTADCTVTPQQNFVGTVTPLCRNLPRDTTCGFEPGSVTFNEGAVQPRPIRLSVYPGSAAPGGTSAFDMAVTDGVATRSAAMTITIAAACAPSRFPCSEMHLNLQTQTLRCGETTFTSSGVSVTPSCTCASGVCLRKDGAGFWTLDGFLTLSFGGVDCSVKGMDATLYSTGREAASLELRTNTALLDDDVAPGPGGPAEVRTLSVQSCTHPDKAVLRTSGQSITDLVVR